MYEGEWIAKNPLFLHVDMFKLSGCLRWAHGRFVSFVSGGPSMFQIAE